jgi:hypothetical protein
MKVNSCIFNFKKNFCEKLFKIILFSITVLVIDKVVGSYCNNLFENTSFPQHARLRYIIDSLNQEIVLLGSSKAENQFIPSIITKLTGISSYNCGFSGQGLQFSYIQLCEIVKRHKPKIVILDVTPNILLDPDSQEKLNILLPLFNRDTLIYNAITNNRTIEKIKLLSSIYPYNSIILDLIRGIYFKHYKDSMNGFSPLYGVIDTTDIKLKINRDFAVSNIPSSKTFYLKKIIELCNKEDILSVIIISPAYCTNVNFNKIISNIQNIVFSQSKQIIFWNMSQDSTFINRQDLFYNNLHLNYEGAKLYSFIIANRINQLLNKDQY